MLDKRTTLHIDGPVGALETVINRPRGEAQGLALVAHPHPLYGGTLDNKVTQTLATAFTQLGYVSVRMNFRGVGTSAGTYDEGRGETEDWLALHDHMRQMYPHLPLFLAGFSFGAYVMSEVARRVQCQQLVLVGPAVRAFPLQEVASNTLVIHGELDTTIPLRDVLDWATPQDLPLVLVPGADHFFHHRLHHIKTWVTRVCYVPARS